MVKRDVGGKKGKLLCCKRIFDWIKANLAEIQLKKHQNVQKTHFLQKVPGVNGLNELCPVLHLEKFSLNFSCSSFAIRVNLLHP